MPRAHDDPGLAFPHPAPPAFGVPSEVAPGVLWLRLPLPYRLDHVNIYLIENDGGWTALDSGLGDDACKEAWQAALAGPLLIDPLTASYERHTLIKRQDVPESQRVQFVVGRFTQNDSLMGAVALVLRRHGRLA